MKYRKKPVVIEAFQLERRELNWPQWAHDALTENVIISHNTGKWHNPSEETYLIIKTLEGNHKACLGDYIIRGVKGEIYPCKPDIFELTYESVSDGIGEIYDTKKIPTAHGSTMHGMGFR